VAEVTTDDLVQRLRAGGVRVTAPRRAVVEALAAIGSHATAEQLHDHVRARHPEVSASSVYRTMELLARLGIVTHVHLGHGPAEYHLAHEEHAHLVCEGCGAVVEIPRQLTEPFVRDVRHRLGFVPDLQHFALTGRCAGCESAFDAGAAGREG
jgi:Fur family transcriptional regulator, ferric uptake regulator